MTPIPTCGACNAPLHDHPQCVMARCACLMHKGVWCRHDPAICRDCDQALYKRGARRCKGCGEIKPLRSFRHRPGHYYRTCHTCRGRQPKKHAERQRYYQRHRERLTADYRRHYAANPDRKRRANQAYYQAHRAELIARTARWRAANPDRQRAQNRAWVRANPQRRRAIRRRYYQRRKLAMWFGR